ncbi:MAG: hypothetical protein Q4P71_09915 [Actinomycetaceae bacterium]|nr:hypothetical protein [Actinomycetaceae bacterium]
MRSFFATTHDDWTDPAGQLHAYLVPDTSYVQWAQPIRERLDIVPFLAVQPQSALHATVQRFPFLLSEITQEQIDTLRNTAREGFADFASLELTFGAPSLMADAVVTYGGDPNNLPEGWKNLVERVRSVAQEALGPEGVHYAPPFGPHITLAYGTNDGEDSVIEDVLGEQSEAGTITFQDLAWCAVHQFPDRGIYTFTELFRTPFAKA